MGRRSATSTGDRLLNISQLYETTILDNGSDLSAHFVIIPASAMPEGSYTPHLPPWDELGLYNIADVPLGGVVRSLTELLRAENVEQFGRIFQSGSERELTHRATREAGYFAFAEYLTFARVLPTEDSSLFSDSLGNIMTKQLYSTAQFVFFENAEDIPLMYLGTADEILLCGSVPGMSRALESGLRERALRLMRGSSEDS